VPLGQLNGAVAIRQSSEGTLARRVNASIAALANNGENRAGVFVEIVRQPANGLTAPRPLDQGFLNTFDDAGNSCWAATCHPVITKSVRCGAFRSKSMNEILYNRFECQSLVSDVDFLGRALNSTRMNRMRPAPTSEFRKDVDTIPG
jgi:hypothetical protein